MPSRRLRLLSLSILLLLTACTKKEANLSAIIPSSLSFTGQSGRAVAQSKQLSFKNTGNAVLAYSAGEALNWLKVTPAKGSLSPQQVANLTVQATCADLPEGDVNGSISLSSNAPGSPQTVTVQLSCSAPPASNYSIDVQTLGAGFNDARRAVFTQAALLWSSYVTGDLSDTPLKHDANEACGFGEPAFSGTIDDLRIYASIEPIDGVGGILGGAGPAAIRPENGLSVVGCMRFDSADITALEASGTFDEVILHEMGHVLGIGVLWEEPKSGVLLDYATNPPGRACDDTTARFTQDPVFTGSTAVAEFRALGGEGNIPVENEYNQGTRCGHWDEEFFETELMTGFLGPGNVNPISRMTIASLKDLGYTVDFSLAEPYSIPPCSPNCRNLQQSTKRAERIQELIFSPRFVVSPDGQLTALPRD